MLLSSKWKEEDILKLYLCVSSSAFHLFAGDSIQILSYSRTVKPNNQFWVLPISHLNALRLLLICSGFNLPLGLALHGSSGILSSSSLILTNYKWLRHLWILLFRFLGGEERRCCLHVLPCFKNIYRKYCHIDLRASHLFRLIESYFFCSHVFLVSPLLSNLYKRSP